MDVEIYANAEYAVPKRRYKRIVSVITCVITGVSGFLAYAYLGAVQIGCFKENGLCGIAASVVFDGVVKRIEPVTWSFEEPPLDIPDDEPMMPEEIEDEVSIVAKDLACRDMGFVYNETDYDTKGLSVETSAVVPEYRENSTVLIIHSHGTESYAEGSTVSESENFRTTDTEKNMIAVGKRFAEILEENGINVIHCTEMFDRQSYTEAYGNSARAVKRYMEEYPDIDYVIDIHRDALTRANGDIIKSDGGNGAQVMIVCGTDSGGANFPHWQENFAFGMEYQRIMLDRYPSLARYMNLRRASFNQQLCDRYLLLEIGTCGNTLEEALACSEKAAMAFGELITGR